MKKLLFFSFSILMLNVFPLAAQNDNQGDLREKSLRFFVNSIDFLSKKGDNILPAFKKNHNKRIIYRYSNKNIDLVNTLYYTQKANPDWKEDADRVMAVSKNFHPKYEVVQISDPVQDVKKAEYDLNAVVSNELQDGEFRYVIISYKSVGSMAMFYTGEIMCKYDAKGNLVKYSSIEK